MLEVPLLKALLLQALLLLGSNTRRHADTLGVGHDAGTRPVGAGRDAPVGDGRGQRRRIHAVSGVGGRAGVDRTGRVRRRIDLRHGEAQHIPKPCFLVHLQFNEVALEQLVFHLSTRSFGEIELRATRRTHVSNLKKRFVKTVSQQLINTKCRELLTVCGREVNGGKFVLLAPGP